MGGFSLINLKLLFSVHTFTRLRPGASSRILFPFFFTVRQAPVSFFLQLHYGY